MTDKTNLSLSNVLFDNNSAAVSGPTLFGGLLDRCIVSPFNEVDRTINRTNNELLTYKGNGLQYFMDISNEMNMLSMSSYPVKVCHCINGSKDCGYKTEDYFEVKILLGGY